MPIEQVLDVFPKDHTQRLVVVAMSGLLEGNRIVLRQESFSDGGWFVQCEMDISAEQVRGLKLLLTSQPTSELCGEDSRPNIVPFSRSQQRSA